MPVPAIEIHDITEIVTCDRHYNKMPGSPAGVFTVRYIDFYSSDDKVLTLRVFLPKEGMREVRNVWNELTGAITSTEPVEAE